MDQFDTVLFLNFYGHPVEKGVDFLGSTPGIEVNGLTPGKELFIIPIGKNPDRYGDKQQQDQTNSDKGSDDHFLP